MKQLPPDVIDFFPEHLDGNDDLERILNNLFTSVDKKNADGRPAFVNTAIDSNVQQLESVYGLSGLSKEGLSKEKAISFIKEFAKVQAEHGLSFNPRSYIAHMLTGLQTIPGLAGMLQGLLMHGNAVTDEVSPFAGAIEVRAGKQVKEMLGYDPNSAAFKQAASFITIGGTDANHLALFVARNWSYFQNEGINVANEGFYGLLGKGKIRRPAIIVPESMHYSFDKIANDLFIGKDNLIKVRSDLKHRMDIDDLVRKLESIDPEEQKVIAAVSVFGSTETGATDDIVSFLEIIKHYEQEFGESIWTHLDAAYGGPALLCDDFAEHRKAASKFDSVTFDPHKQLWVPYNAGSLTFRDARTLRLVSTDAPYIGNGDMNDMSAEEFIEKISSHPGAVKLPGSQLTGGILATYLTMQCLGTERIRQVIEYTRGLAHHMAKKLGETRLPFGKIEVVAENPDLNITNWRYVPNEASHLTKGVYHSPDQNSPRMNQLNELNERIFKYFKERDEEHIISHTKLKTSDMEIQRAVFMHPRTTTEDIDRFVDAYARHVTSLGPKPLSTT
ncbi:MAG: aspartate aminotransferase family protein [Candidatus Woesearchaeota archaeon]|nr:MAG: aspartate aminotransferase family protein [Candidatus Woesearchaeota archaeon]